MRGNGSDFYWLWKILLVVFVFSNVAYFSWFGWLGDSFRSTNPDSWLVRKLSTNGADWGTFGDFLGGFLNPIIAGVTLWIVIKDSAIARRQALELAVEKKVALDLQKENLRIQERIFTLQNETANVNWLVAISRKDYAEYESYLRRDEILWAELVRAGNVEDEVARIKFMIDANEVPLNLARNNIKDFEDILSKMERERKN